MEIFLCLNYGNSYVFQSFRETFSGNNGNTTAHVQVDDGDMVDHDVDDDRSGRFPSFRLNKKLIKRSRKSFNESQFTALVFG